MLSSALIVTIAGMFVGSATPPSEPVDPAIAAAMAEGNVAMCNNGTFSDNTDFEATCSSNDGMAQWLAPFGVCGDGTIIALSDNASCDDHDGFEQLLPADFQPTPGPADVAQCVNGTFSDNTDFEATCSSNDGVAQWLSTRGQCSDGTVVEMSAEADCEDHGGFGQLLPDDADTATAPASAAPTSLVPAPAPVATTPGGGGTDSSSDLSSTAISSEDPADEGAGSEPPVATVTATVTAVEDATTLQVDVDGQPEWVELIGLYVSTGDCDQSTAMGELTELVGGVGATVTLTAGLTDDFDGEVIDRDEESFNEHDPLLRYVATAAGDDVGAAMLETGLARVHEYIGKSHPRGSDYQTIDDSHDDVHPDCSGPDLPPVPPTAQATVTAVNEEGRLEVEIDGRSDQVVLLGVDVPHLDNICGYAESIAYLTDLVVGKQATITAGATELGEPVDRDDLANDALLRYVSVEGVADVGEAMLTAGLATVGGGFIEHPREAAYTAIDEATISPPMNVSSDGCFTFDLERWMAEGLCVPDTNCVGDNYIGDDQADDGLESYTNCDEVRADGADPIYVGDAGWSDHLDGDGDGVACE